MNLLEPEFLKRKTKLNANGANMTKIRTKHCYNINKLVRCVKILSEFSLNTLIVQEIFLSFPSFPLFFNFFIFFPDFPGLPLSAVNPA